MIKVTSYLKENDSFLPIEEFSGEIVDTDYIEGAIFLVVNGKPVLTLQHWDYVDQLWAYIIDGLESISKNEDFETYFPDQPLELKFNNVNFNRVKIVLDGTEIVSINKKEFVTSIKRASIHFFKELTKILPKESEYYSQFIKRVEAIK